MPNPKTIEWLDEVCTYISKPYYKKAVRKELEAHIEDKIRQLENDGLSREQAEEQAVMLMGNAEKTGKAFNALYKPNPRKFIICILILIIVIFAINFITKSKMPTPL